MNKKPMAYILILFGVATALLGVVLLLAETRTEPGQDARETTAITEKISAPCAATASLESAQPTSAAAQPSSSAAADQPEVTTALTPKEKGNQFESFIADLFTEKNGFKLIEWNQGTTSPGGNYAENELKPDFYIQRNKEHRKPLTFWLECKYLTALNGPFRLKQYQFDRYKAHQRATRRKVLIALGLGGAPSAPSALYIIPVDSLTSPIPETELANYKLSIPAQSISTYIDTYFYIDVFKKK